MQLPFSPHYVHATGPTADSPFFEQAIQIEEYQQPKLAINRLTMGRGCGWDPMETLHACKAWSQATNNATKGNGQKSADFWDDVTARFHRLAPKDSDKGTYSARTSGSVKNQLLNKVFPDCSKFSKAVRKVDLVKLTGNLSPDQVYNITVAFHLEKTKDPDYDYKDFESDKHWANSLAYKNCLKFEPKWMPLRYGDRGKDSAEEEVTEDAASSNNNSTNSDSSVVSGPEFIRRLSTSSRKSSKRGGVAGRDSTKEKIRRTAMNDKKDIKVAAADKLTTIYEKNSRIKELKLLIKLSKKSGDDELAKDSTKKLNFEGQ